MLNWTSVFWKDYRDLLWVFWRRLWHCNASRWLHRHLHIDHLQACVALQCQFCPFPTHRFLKIRQKWWKILRNSKFKRQALILQSFASKVFSNSSRIFEQDQINLDLWSRENTIQVRSNRYFAIKRQLKCNKRP